MSKGLEALDNLLHLDSYGEDRKEYMQELGDVIEKELKERDEYKLKYAQTHTALCKLREEKTKKEQALEIIRDKRVNVDYFIYTCVKNNWSYEDYLDEISNSDNLALCGQYCFSNKQPILTQEEYDLLKGELYEKINL